MKTQPICLIILAVLWAGAFSSSARSEDWPAWRGPRGDGISTEENVPADWDVAHATWKTALPGAGHASPIVCGDRIVTATALPEKLDRILLCLDRATGKVLWQETAAHGPLEKINPENSYASGTPATDGKRVYAAFMSGDDIVVVAHNLTDGKQLWRVKAGTHNGPWGIGSSPVVFKDKVILDGDSKGDCSFLIALARDDGRTLWRIERSHKGMSFSTPLIRQMAGRWQLIQCGDRCVSSFDPETGKELWTVDGPSQEFVATPFFDDTSGLVFASSSWPERHLLAIRPDGGGNVSQTHVAWRDKKGAPYIPSFVVVNDLLLSIDSGGTVFCREAATGKVFWQEKLGRHHASPLLAGGLVYFINDEGRINVIKPGTKFDRVAQFELGEQCYASPAISNGQVFLRGFEHLFCIGKVNEGGKK